MPSPDATWRVYLTEWVTFYSSDATARRDRLSARLILSVSTRAGSASRTGGWCRQSMVWRWPGPRTACSFTAEPAGEFKDGLMPVLCLEKRSPEESRICPAWFAAGAGAAGLRKEDATGVG